MGTNKGETTPLGNPVAFDGGLVQVGERTWAWLQPNGGLGESNAGLVVGDEESMLIDTLWDERLTAAMLEAMEPVAAAAGAPIRQLFNTHGDGDHWYGNGLLDPAVAMIASERAVAQMRSEPPSILTRMAPVGTAAGVLGKVPMMPGAGRLRGLAAFNAMLGAYEFKGIQPRVPGRSFPHTAELEVGGRRVELTYVGPAHTVGDAIAWLPDARIVFAGDILFSGVMPIMWAGPVANWIAALDLILELGPEAVIGGHGPVGGADEITALRDYWVWLRERVLEAGPDIDPSQLSERLIRSTEFEPWADWDGRERTLVSVARIAATEAGGDSEIGTAERIKLISAMGELGERLAG
jgi:glyoxylase-like metal-dependent hydrolase (beta-lactamase superfamily II)